MVRAILSILFVVASSVAAFAATCEVYDVKTFIGDSPYLLNRMTITQDRGADWVHVVHDDDPGISAVFALEKVEERPIVRRSEFVGALNAVLLSQSAELESEGRRDVERGIYPYDPMAWTISSVDATGQERMGTTSIALSRDCDLVVTWWTSTAPVLASRVVEFKAALDAVRAFSGRHVAPPQFLSENTSPQGLYAVLTAFVAPVLATIALIYGLNSMLMLPRPGMGPRVLSIVGAAVAGGSIILGLANFEGGLSLFLLSMGGLLVSTVVLNLLAAILPRQLIALGAFCLMIVTGLAFGCAAYLGWLPDAALAYGIGVALVMLGGTGLYFWQYLESTRIRRRTTKSV